MKNERMKQKISYDCALEYAGSWLTRLVLYGSFIMCAWGISLDLFTFFQLFRMDRIGEENV